MVTQTGLNQHGLEPKMDTEPLNPTSLAMSPASWAKAAESPGAGRERSGKNRNGPSPRTKRRARLQPQKKHLNHQSNQIMQQTNCQRTWKYENAPLTACRKSGKNDEILKQLKNTYENRWNSEKTDEHLRKSKEIRAFEKTT